MSTKFKINYIANLIYCDIVTDSIGKKVYFKTILDYPDKKKPIMDTGLGGSYSGPVIKNYKAIPDTYRITGTWTRAGFNGLIKALQKAGAEIKTIQETL